jgi:hypothetical protein
MMWGGFGIEMQPATICETFLAFISKFALLDFQINFAATLISHSIHDNQQQSNRAGWMTKDEFCTAWY